MIKSRKQMFVVIGIFTLLLFLGGVTYAFFNYTRTGGINNLGTGRISFNTTEGPALNLTNLFPMTSEEAEEANLNSISIDIEGDTTYSGGEEYVISIVDINNTINGKEIPMNYIASYVAKENKTIGTNNASYWEDRNDKDANIYILYNEGKVEENKHVLVGYIDNEGDGISGTLTIKAYIDEERIAISDTYYGNAPTPAPTGPNDEYGTPTTWANGKVVLTTDEWNSLSSNPISFKVRAESNEGIWAKEQLSRNDMMHIVSLFDTGGAFEGRKSEITDINFIRESEEIINTHSDAIDITDANGEGVVKTWIDGTKMYIVSPGATYFPQDSGGMFVNFTNVTSITFDNINTSVVTNMGSMFSGCNSLTDIDLSGFDTSNVISMGSMFINCSSLENIDLSYLDTSSVINMNGMFSNCTNLESVNVSGLGSNTLSGAYLFNENTSLKTIIMQDFNFGSAVALGGYFGDRAPVLEMVDLSNAKAPNTTNIISMFHDLTSLTTVNMSGMDLSSVRDMINLFGGCTSLTTVNLSGIDTSSVTNMTQMFSGCTSLSEIDISSFNTSNVTSMMGMFAMGSYNFQSNTWTPSNNALTTIKVGSGWNPSNATNSANMFYNCTHLVGGSGTIFSSTYLDKTYAHVDGGTSDPGYLTLKTS